MEPLLTAKETADVLKVTVRTVYNLLERGELRGVKVGRVWRFSEDELKAYLERNVSNE
jgi:excisionase family DNA binding protein